MLGFAPISALAISALLLGGTPPEPPVQPPRGGGYPFEIRLVDRPEDTIEQPVIEEVAEEVEPFVALDKDELRRLTDIREKIAAAKAEHLAQEKLDELAAAKVVLELAIAERQAKAAAIAAAQAREEEEMTIVLLLSTKKRGFFKRG